MVATGSPRGWTRPSPSVTYSVWPIEWLCQSVRAPGAKCTEPMLTGEGPRASSDGRDPHVAGEPVGRSLSAGVLRSDFHDGSFLSFPAGSGPEQRLDRAAFL